MYSNPNNDPVALFQAWLTEAEAREPNDPNAMALATSTPDGRPSLRMVLLKGCDARGFVFYTNLESRKGREIAANPHAALCWHWKSLRRQVRAEGPLAPVTAAEADAYFASRAYVSRIGARASEQSRPLPERAVLEARVAAERAAHPEGEPVPRPANWSGFRLEPETIEFWQDGAFRLHDRRLFTRAGEGSWTMGLLYP